MARKAKSSSSSIPQLRRWLVVSLTIATLAFTVTVFVLVQRIFDTFGPGVASDLSWKTLRGSQELARAVDLGLAVQDADVVRRAFGDYKRNDDVVAIVAESSSGVVVASHGKTPRLEGGLFSGPPTILRTVGDLLVAWAPAVIEGSPVGRVALVVSTKRLVDSRILLKRLSTGTVSGGVLVWILGLVFVLFFTRSIAARDAQLAEYASGLEKKVVERTAELAHINDGMRLVLDNVEQGFITIDLQGVMSLERSTVCARWFGAPAPGQSLVEALRRYDSLAAEWLHVGLDEIREGILPLKLLIHQLPAHIRLGERAMRLAYQPIYGANLSSSAKEGTRPSGGPEHLLVVITDITEELARERVERDSREMIHMFQRIALDRDGFTQFMEEVSAMIEKLKDGSDSIATERRLVHTIKGNTSLYGIESMAKVCHELETKLAEEERAIKADEHKQLAQAWDHVQAMVAPFLGNHRAAVELEEDDYQSLLQAIRAGATTDKLLAIVVAWRRELVSVRFQRLADKAQYLAKRLGKPAPTIHQQARGIRLDAHRWNAFWSALAHAINNALDHGIEGVDARRAANKPGAGQVWLDAEMKSGELVISVRDDGGGIDWAKVAIKAAARGLPHQTQPDLIEALFTDGVSTRNEASLTSGRGTGMGALRQAVRDLGGSTNVTSTPGQGTTLSFRFSPEAQVGIDHAA